MIQDGTENEKMLSKKEARSKINPEIVELINRLFEYAKRKYLGDEVLASKIGVNTMTVYRWRKHKNYPVSPIIIEKIKEVTETN